MIFFTPFIDGKVIRKGANWESIFLTLKKRNEVFVKSFEHGVEKLIIREQKSLNLMNHAIYKAPNQSWAALIDWLYSLSSYKVANQEKCNDWLEFRIRITSRVLVLDQKWWLFILYVHLISNEDVKMLWYNWTFSLKNRPRNGL